MASARFTILPSTPPKELQKYLPQLLPGWKQAEVPIDIAKLPPLLEIKTDKLAKQALWHRSWDGELSRSEVLRRGKYERELESYEVFETVGDLYLSHVVSSILRKRYPDLTSSPLSELRQELVQNTTLSHVALAYGLPRRMYRAPDREHLERHQSVAADLFEAHVGALYEDEKIPTSQVEEWLSKVFSTAVLYDLDARVLRLKEKKLEAEVKSKEVRGQVVAKDPVTEWRCARCDSKLNSVKDKPTFAFDPIDHRKGWHARMYYEGKFVGCGHAMVKQNSESAALVSSIGKNARRKRKTQAGEQGARAKRGRFGKLLSGN